jgi:hypothetical protein
MKARIALVGVADIRHCRHLHVFANLPLLSSRSAPPPRNPTLTSAMICSRHHAERQLMTCRPTFIIFQAPESMRRSGPAQCLLLVNGRSGQVDVLPIGIGAAIAQSSADERLVDNSGIAGLTF